jgi:hypothetical protein
MFSTFAEFFARAYNFSAGVGGLAYLGLGVGFFLATLVGGRLAGHVYTWVRL